MSSTRNRKAPSTHRPTVEALDERVVPATGSLRAAAFPFALHARAVQFSSFGRGNTFLNRPARGANLLAPFSARAGTLVAGFGRTPFRVPGGFSVVTFPDGNIGIARGGAVRTGFSA